jgi:hypothetical protein
MAQDCVECHSKITPGIVADWKISKHFENDISCNACHGDGHQSANDVQNVSLPTAETCGTCHEEKLAQFSRGKHAVAWSVLNTVSLTHQMPMVLIAGQKNCNGCHKIGLKTDEDVLKLKTQGSMFGNASCDACHTRHAFSKKEAQQPQACQTCHMGYDNSQWEMYSSSKHGVRAFLKQNGTLSDFTAAPTCQTCHMQEGSHEVRTAWGFLGVKLPLPEDPQWKADHSTILNALDILDAEGNPTSRLDDFKEADVARLTQEDFDRERNKMINTCVECHSSSFVNEQFDNADKLIKEVDHLLAEGIREVVALYEEGVLVRPESYFYSYPDLTPIEQILFDMQLKYRMQAFQGAFHMNPDYSLWYGWSEMVRALSDIKQMATQLREEKKK